MDKTLYPLNPLADDFIPAAYRDKYQKTDIDRAIMVYICEVDSPDLSLMESRDENYATSFTVPGHVAFFLFTHMLGLFTIHAMLYSPSLPVKNDPKI